jgi:hypothetical protein
MFSASGRPRRASLAIGIAAYAIIIAFTAGMTTHVAWRAGAALLAYLVPAAETPPARDVAAGTRTARAAMSVPGAPQQSVRSEATMTPLADQWDGRLGGTYGRPQPRVWGSAGSPFGSSSRNPNRRYDRDDGLFGSDDEERRPAGTFRTVCVRLCDGYYFPVSFAVGADRLDRDRNVCESRCGSQGRLFVHPNPGGSIDDLRDLAGRPYSQLRTAFLYRTEYVADCKCKAHPWEQQAADQHRLYALAAAKRKGDKEAATQLTALESRMRDTTPQARPSKSARWSLGSDASDAARSKQAGLADASNDPELMRLGPARKEARGQDAKQPPNREADWARDLWR